MRGSAAEARLLGAIGALRISAVLQIKPDLVETLLGHIVLGFGTQVSTIDDSVYQLLRMRPQVTSALHATDALEA